MSGRPSASTAAPRSPATAAATRRRTSIAAATRRAPRAALAIQYVVPAATLPSPTAVRRWARSTLERDAAVTLRFVGTREGRTLNALYRGKDYATNVLAFVYDATNPVAGDVVLCAPVLRREAKAQGKPIAHHCAHLVVHGMLHLQGYDHHTARAARAMEARETAILARLGVPDPYAPSRLAAPEGAGRRRRA